MINLYEKIELGHGRLDIKFAKEFRETNIVVDDFWAKYTDIDLSDLDESILNIPVLLNVAPAIWAMNIDVKVPVLDKELDASFEKLKPVFKAMYPKLQWAGNIRAEKLVDNTHLENKGSALFFSGGLDSVFSTIRHIDEKPLLVSVRGSDVSLSDIYGWELVKKQSQDFSDKYRLKVGFIESNFYDFLNQGMLSGLDDGIPGWWAGVQHGMGFAGLMAPISEYNKVSSVYIASSHSKEFHAPWGSRPDIDNNVSYSFTKIQHDGYEFTRHGKVKELINRCQISSLDKPMLRVCYSNHLNAGKNCCLCEKCSRTMTALWVEGENPNDYSFDITTRDFVSNVKKIFSSNKVITNANSLFMWNDIIRDIKPSDFYKTKNLPESIIKYLEWLAFVDLDAYKNSYDSSVLRKNRIKNIIKFVPGLFPLAKKMKTILKG
jgi:hypothetical protein